MNLKFCPKCKTLLSPRQTNKELFLKCRKCGFSKKLERYRLTASEKIKPKLRGKGVIDDKNILATYKHKCKKCGYDKAQVLDLGIFYSDEDNLILLKCGKCGYSERIGRKVS